MPSNDELVQQALSDVASAQALLAVAQDALRQYAPVSPTTPDPTISSVEITGNRTVGSVLTAVIHYTTNLVKGA